MASLLQKDVFLSQREIIPFVYKQVFTYSIYKLSGHTPQLKQEDSCFNHYGELKSFVLPDTGWEVYYSTKYFKMSRKYNGSIIPDVLIEKDPLSYFSGIDKEILYCLQKNN